MTARIVMDLQLGEAVAALDRLQQLDGDRANLMLLDMGEYLLGVHQRRFDAEVSPEGQPWAPLSSRYKKRKDKARPGAKKLVYDNLLKGTLRYLVENAQLVFGSDRPQAALLHFGGKIQRAPRSTQVHMRGDGKRKRFAAAGSDTVARWVTIPAYTIEMPARPWLGLSKADDEEVLRIAADHVGDAVTG